MTDGPQRAHPTIGYLTTAISPGVGLAVWSGVVDAAQERAANLFTFLGGPLSDPVPFGAQANILYSLAAACDLDGLLIWASSIGGFVDHAEVDQLCQRYAPRPMVNLTLPLRGIPTTVIDSYGGMRELVEHMITMHGYRRLGFIRGPETHYYAQERYRAYADVLREYGLTLDPRLVTPPLDWTQATGSEAIRVLLDERNVRLKVDVDAIVAANDAFALGAIATLRSRGIQVPREVAVVGFNDSQESRFSTPPLTSVALPFHQQGSASVGLLLEAMAGRNVPAQLTLLPRLVVRQSCGCPDPEVVRAADQGAPAIRGSLAALAAQRRRFAADMERADGGFAPGSTPGLALRLWDAMMAELGGGPGGCFLAELEGVLSQADGDDDLSEWQNLVSLLRRTTLGTLAGTALQQAEAMWQQARVTIGKHAHRTEARRCQEVEAQATVLRQIGAACNAVADLEGLMDVLAEGLPRLGIPSGCLALYGDPQPWRYPQEVPPWSEWVMAYDRRGRVAVEPGGCRFRSGQLLPPELVPANDPHSFVVVPLYFREQQLGLAVLETGPRDGTVYDALRVQISSALQGVRLLTRNVELYHQALRAEEEAEEGRRLAEEADSLKSRFLSMVSHELLTPLVLLVGLSEMMLKEAGADQTTIPESHRQDLQRIYTSSQHLGSLVRDVLDLARSQVGELRLTRAPLNLGETLRAVALVGEELARTKGLTWYAEIPAQLPLVMGDAARLQQVALNLVTNAIKFTAAGHVRLTVAGDGERVRVCVSDTGLGVPLAEQQLIFDEFRQSERTATRGYGGLGIGLAICRQLVTLHGGEIGVRSSGEEDGGSEFYFSLPVASEEELAADQDVRLSTVLVLAQRAADGAYLREQLSRQGFEVQVLGMAETPHWRPHLLSAPPGAIVLDARAADLAWDITALLKQRPATSDIPVVLCALSPESDGGAALSLDAMTKPLAGEALAEALRRHGLAPAETGEPTIMVVDDDPHILEMHSRLARSAVPQARIVGAANGRLALERMRQAQPTLVLLDLMMPEVDGFAVLEAMQADEQLRRIPVIVLTAQSLSQSDMARLNQGVAAVLGKGLFSAEETLARIEAALAVNKRLGSEAQRTVRKAMACVHEHYAESLTRDDIAGHAAVSVRHLNRCFAEEMGISPMTYLQRYRIAQAKRLLETSSQSITEVALAVGFGGSSYFAETFRKETGVSASEYRRQCGQGSPPQGE
jgi:signal transduction histidine kinase/DNA-binding LacI/PurR family transcriptional regulator/AraC-like DNA-binding protein